MKKLIRNLSAMLAVVPAIALIGSAVPVYAADDTSSCSASNGIVGSADCAKGNGQSESLTDENGVFKTVTNILLFIVGAVAVIMLVIGGIRYTISGGDSKQVEAAKNTILYSIIGIVVAILAYAAVNFVITSFTSSGS